MMWRRRWVLRSLAAWPAACSSPNPTLYVLAAEPGAVRNGAPRNIELRDGYWRLEDPMPALARSITYRATPPLSVNTDAALP